MDDYYYQQDNDPKHKSYLVRQWLLYHTPHTLETPPQSPDIKPIEHLWEELDQRLRKHSISNKNDLKDVLLQEWNNIGENITNTLVQSMPKRLQAVLDQKGYPTKY